MICERANGRFIRSREELDALREELRSEGRDWLADPKLWGELDAIEDMLEEGGE